MQGNPYIKGLICECAWSIVHTRNSYLANFYWKIKQKRGSKRAIIALGRKIIVIIFNILKNKTMYNEDKFELTRQKQEMSRLKHISSEAKKLGYTLLPLEISPKIKKESKRA